MSKTSHERVMANARANAGVATQFRFEAVQKCVPSDFFQVSNLNIFYVKSPNFKMSASIYFKCVSLNISSTQ